MEALNRIDAQALQRQKNQKTLKHALLLKFTAAVCIIAFVLLDMHETDCKCVLPKCVLPTVGRVRRQTLFQHDNGNA
jgi:hypothetical protein